MKSFHVYMNIFNERQISLIIPILLQEEPTIDAYETGK